MTIHIPAAILWTVAILASWIAAGWVMRAALFAVEPGIPMGLDRHTRRMLLLWGPLGIWMPIALLRDRREADRMRRDHAAEQAAEEAHRNHGDGGRD